MGAGISEAYRNISEPLFCVGMWRVSTAIHIKTNQECSFWQFDYDIMKGMSKADQKIILDGHLRSLELLQTIDHPGVLKVREASDSVRALNFAAEPVMAALEAPLAFNDSLYLAWQMCEVLSYVQDSCHRVIFDLTHGSWVIGSGMRVKLCCLALSGEITNDWGTASPRVPHCPALNLSYAAPELAQGTMAMGRRCDVWSFAMVWSWMIAGRIASPDSVEEVGRNVSLPLGLPGDLVELVRRCVSIYSEKRPSWAEIQAHPVFSGTTVRALIFIDGLDNVLDQDRFEFYVGVARTLDQFGPRALWWKVLPLCLAEIRRERRFAPYLLPVALEIGRVVPKDRFVADVLAPLESIVRESNVLPVALGAMDVMVEQMDATQLSQNAWPMVKQGLGEAAARSAAVAAFEKLIRGLDPEPLVMEELIGLCSFSTDVKLVASCLSCLTLCLTRVDHVAFVERVVPRLEAAWNRLSEPADLVKVVALMVERINVAIDVAMRDLVPLVSRVLAVDSNPGLQLGLIQFIREVTGSYMVEKRLRKGSLGGLVGPATTSESAASSIFAGLRVPKRGVG